jgi:hypothetical protein
MHILLKLIMARPHLLADHAKAYAELIASDCSDASVVFTRRAILGGSGLIFLLVATVLAGVALLLCAVIPAAQIQAPWALIVVPLVPLAASVVCLVSMRALGHLSPFANLRNQARADMEMLRESSTP